MKEKDYSIARELREKLSKAVKLVDFRVFGSRVRGGYSGMTDKQTLFTYRLKQGEETLLDAKKMLQNNLSPRFVLNRAYYSISHTTAKIAESHRRRRFSCLKGMKAIALVSGGLDSTLAARIIKDLPLELIALNTRSPFCLCNRKKEDGSCSHEAARVSQELGVKLIALNTSFEFLEIVKKPKFGYGSYMNPCLDCRILLFKKAKEAMQKEGASFVITGEVLGQRPMSQRLAAMRLIEQEAGLEGLVVRPLSARVLEPTIPEKQGWIDRAKLLAISGRGRKEQIALASELGIKDYPCPSGGCLLTDPEFSRRLKDLMQYGELNLKDIQLLKIGRHFRLRPDTKLVVGRNESENSRLETLKEDDDFLFRPEDLAGPSAILRGNIEGSSILESASRIVAKYCDGANEETKIICQRSLLQEYKFIVSPNSEEELAAWRIN